jgi:AcrR family transcriptional regulator
VLVDAAERLIESTRDLLWERGYVGTSPKAIQQRAGAGQGSMYHHFAGKPDLARVALDRSAVELRAVAERELGQQGTGYARISGYLLRKREVLRGCRIGRLAQDPEVIADPVLREPVAGTFEWLRERISQVITEGQESGEFAAALDPVDTAAALVAVLQGGYVLARAADSVEPFNQAMRGALALLAGYDHRD